ncbi:hypothetical protein Tco_1066927 [Tanacetum coccineum]|uniref:Protein FAR1-RELATED SEQUENCE n=1 Tax=Tanacetum coccineum TaxID=301880 RepID=A0ABQ5HC10_9ASTR
MDDNLLNESDLVVDAKNLLIKTKIQDEDDLNVDIDAEENLVPALEYKHLTKKQRKMTQPEKMFVVKASTLKLGATRAHNLYSRMKGGAQYVHGTSDDFKNHIRDINAFIGESDAQMLINEMENRKKFMPNFTFQYKVENSGLVAMFWADEVDFF